MGRGAKMSDGGDALERAKREGFEAGYAAACRDLIGWGSVRIEPPRGPREKKVIEAKPAAPRAKPVVRRRA